MCKSNWTVTFSIWSRILLRLCLQKFLTAVSINFWPFFFVIKKNSHILSRSFQDLKFQTHSFVDLLWWFWSLSCWKIQLQPKPNFRTKSKMLSFKIASHLTEFNVLSMCYCFSCSAAAKHPQMIMLLLCLTVGTKFLSLKSCIRNSPDTLPMVPPQNSGFVSSDYKIFLPKRF